MIITSITPQKDPERVNIFIDKEFAFGIYYITKEEMKLEKGMELDDKKIQSILDRDQVQKARSKAFSYLGIRQRTENEIRTYLLDKEFSENTVELVIEQLTEAGYLDDLEFARTYIRDKATYKGFGPYRLKNELKNKGISKEMVQEAMDDEYREEIDDLVALVKTRYSSIINQRTDKRFRRVGGFLQRKGHSFETIKRILDIIDREDE